MYIHYMTNQVSISNVRARLPNLVSKVNKNLDRVVITVNGQPKAVLVSPEDLESLEETAEILSIPQAKQCISQGIKQIKKGHVIPFKNVVGKTLQEILKR